MTALRDAFTESWAHGIFTVELACGVIVGLLFIGSYARQEWWRNHAGRLTMGNMVALTLLAAGGFLFRLGWQAEALTVLIPTCAVVVFLQAWWLRQLWRAQHATTQECARVLAASAEAFAARLADEGRLDAAEVTFIHARALAEFGDAPTEET